MQTQARDPVERYYSAFDAHSQEWQALVTDDVVFDGPVQHARGKAEFVGLTGQFLQAHGETRLLGRMANGNEVASVFEFAIEAPNGADDLPRCRMGIRCRPRDVRPAGPHPPPRAARALLSDARLCAGCRGHSPGDVSPSLAESYWLSARGISANVAVSHGTPMNKHARRSTAPLAKAASCSRSINAPAAAISSCARASQTPCDDRRTRETHLKIGTRWPCRLPSTSASHLTVIGVARALLSA